MCKDIKYLGVPNICFSLTDKEDSREPEFILQRIKTGFDESETWSLRDTIANFIIPRLERYIEIAEETIVRDKKLINDTNNLLLSLKLVVRDNGSSIYTNEEEKQLITGLNCFSKVFMSLWW